MKPRNEPEFITKYFESLRNHIAYTQEAGRQLGVPEQQLLVHDASKLDPIEWCAYASQFQGSGASRKFARAWLHHIQHNPHHWQHWMFPDGYTIKDSDVVNGILPMPNDYMLEMVADWMGSSMTYTGTWDMTDWLEKHLPRIRLHPNTWGDLREVLRNLGYKV
jgi:hypothetical protein